jgi:hypothetical protein
MVYTFMLLTPLLPLAFAQPTIDLNTEIEAFNQQSIFDLPHLTKEQQEQLWGGDIISYLDGGDAVDHPKRGISFMLTEAKREDLWIACQDPHFQLNKLTLYHLIESDGVDRNLYHGFMDLPWPFSNRHWLTLSWNNHDLSRSSSERYWEHPWSLDKAWQEKVLPLAQAGKLDALRPLTLQEAIYLPENQGAWVMFELESKRLVVYHTTGTVGGEIPESLMLRFLINAMQDLLRDLETTAQTKISEHYVEGHRPMFGGNGKHLPLHPKP